MRVSYNGYYLLSGRAAQQLIYDLSGKALMKQAQEAKKDRER